MRTTAAVWVLALSAVAVSAGPSLPVIEIGVDQPQHTKILAPGEFTVFAAKARPGDYFKGVADVLNGSFDIDLVTGGGQHLRRLATGAAGAVTFQFVAEDEVIRIKATARTNASEALLEISTRISASQQTGASPEYLSPAIASVARDPKGEEAIDAFWTSLKSTGTPLVESGPGGKFIVTFLARGAKRDVRLFGAPSGDHENLERLGQSDIWFKSFIVPAETRLSYKLAYDVPDLPGSARERRMAILATAKADPLNRHPWPVHAPDSYNQDSVLALPKAPEQPGVEERGAVKGTLSEFRIASSRLRNERTITIYRPAGFDPANPNNVVLFLFDANHYLSKVPTPTILDNLIAESRLPPVVAVFVSEIDRDTRARELPGNSDFADFMADELLPRVRKETGFVSPASRTVLAGSSYGGLAAVTVALRHPNAFGRAISLSGSFWWNSETNPPEEPEYVAAWVAKNAKQDVQFHLTAGLFETGHERTPGILDTSRHLRDVLVSKEYRVTYREYAGGHDYLVWRGALADGMIALLN